MASVIIVIIFNVFWVSSYGLEMILEVYLGIFKWNDCKWISLKMWTMVILATLHLIYDISCVY